MKDNIEKFTGTLADFLALVKHDRPGYFFKFRGQNLNKIWWEDWDDWFLNVAFGKKNPETYPESSWVLRKDAEQFLEYMFLRDGYDMYIEKK